MNVTLDDERLFDSGPARVHVGPLRLRHATQEPLDATAAHLFAQGLAARPITQTGTLIADDRDALQAQIDAIESKADGVPRTLRDELDRVWPNTVLISVHPGAPARLGTRWRSEYRIEYVQTGT